MMKVEIELDEQKIIDDGKYVPESILEFVDHIFSENKQQILEAEGFRRVYRDGGNVEKDFAVLGGIVFELAKQEWFFPYAKKIEWSDNEGLYNDEFETEDWLDFFKKNNIGVNKSLCQK